MAPPHSCVPNRPKALQKPVAAQGLSSTVACGALCRIYVGADEEASGPLEPLRCSAEDSYPFACRADPRPGALTSDGSARAGEASPLGAPAPITTCTAAPASAVSRS